MSTPPPGQWPPPPAPQGPPPWTPQQSGRPSGGNGAKWLLGALALLVVVVVTVVTTLLLSRADSGSGTPTAAPSSSAENRKAASENDTGPAALILDDPTCAAWTPIGNTLAEQQAKGWNDRDPLVPAENWSAADRREHEAVAEAMRSAADQTVTLAAQTPHRVMRELYEQSIAYWRAYAERVPRYTAPDDHLANTATSTSNALVWICSAIEFGSAKARAPFIVEAPAPSRVASIGHPAKPEVFSPKPADLCREWHDAVSQFQQDTIDWLAIDPNLSASQWTPEQRETYTRTTISMETNAGRLQDIGIRSGDPMFEDFATLAAQYRRAYVSAIPSYTPSDNYLASVASQVVAAIDEACRASGN